MSGQKFKFRFEPMLKVRKHKEKEKQREHADAVGNVIRQKESLKGIDNKRLSTMEKQRQTQSLGKILVAEMLVCSRYMMKLKTDRIAESQILNGLQKKAEEKRIELVRAARDRKIYEMLKEKQKLKHIQNIEKQDQKELDEVATISFNRKRKKGDR